MLIQKTRSFARRSKDPRRLSIAAMARPKRQPSQMTQMRTLCPRLKTRYSGINGDRSRPLQDVINTNQNMHTDDSRESRAKLETQVGEVRRGKRAKKVHWKLLQNVVENHRDAARPDDVIEYHRRSHGGLISTGNVAPLLSADMDVVELHWTKGFEFMMCRARVRGEQRRSATETDPVVFLDVDRESLRLLTHAELRHVVGVVTGHVATSTKLIRQAMVQLILNHPARSEFFLILKGKKNVNPDPAREEDAQAAHDTVSSECDNPAFPPCPADNETKERVINAWADNQTADAIEEIGCAICGTLCPRREMSRMNELCERELSLLTIDLSSENPCTREESGRSSTASATAGPVLLNGLTHACATCMSFLKRDKTPPESLANGLWVGEVPDALKSLGFFEKLLISRVRFMMYVVKSQSSNRNKLRGNIMTFRSPTQKIYDALPPPRKDMETVLAYVHMGPSPPDGTSMSRLPVFVRRNKVKEALEWLKQNHIGYKDTDIDEVSLNEYGEDDIPVQVLYKHTDGNSNRDEAATAVYDAEEEEGVESGDCPFAVSGLTDESLDDWDNPSAIKIAVLRELHSGQPVLGVGRSQKPVSILNNPEHIASAFPWLFPYGLGVFGSTLGKKRKRELTFATWARHKLMYHDKRFQMDETFTFFVFNLMQVKESGRAAFITTRRKDFKTVAEKFTTLSTAALDRLIAKNAMGMMADLRNKEEADCISILKLLQCTSRNVFGSMSAKRSMRKQLWSMVEQIGAPTWFITVSPPEHKSPICLYYADTQVPFSLEKRTADRARELIAKNPTAGARYFHYIVTMLIDFVLGKGFDDGTGLFGPVDAYYGTVEQQGRLTLHVHMLIFIANALPPDEVKKRLISKDSSFRERLIQYLEESHTGDFLPDKLADPAATTDGARDSAAFKVQQELPIRVPSTCSNRCGSCVQCLENLHWFENFPGKVNEIVRCSNRHTCSVSSCKKSGRADCKARFPRPLFPETEVTEDGYINLKKGEPYLNTFNPVMSYLTMCNTDVTCLRTGTALKAEIAYVTDYISKSELRTTTFHECIKHVLRRKELEQTTEHESEETNARTMLMRMTNRLTAEQEIGSPFAALYVLGNPDRYTNVEFVPLNWKQYVRLTRAKKHRKRREENQLVEDGNEQEENTEEEDEERVGVVKSRRGITMYNATDDYVHRPVELEYASPYTFHINYEVCRKTGNALKRAGAGESDKEDDAEDGSEREERQEHVGYETNRKRGSMRHGRRNKAQTTMGGTTMREEAQEEESESDNREEEQEDVDEREEERNREGEGKSSRMRTKTERQQQSEQQEKFMQRFDGRMRKLSKRRRPNSSYEFEEGHPKKDTHMVKPRASGKGYSKTLAHFSSALPRKDGADHEYYCATMMVLLLPWRTTSDLLRECSTWTDAFKTCAMTEESVRLMKNFNVLHECLDARDDYATQRKKQAERQEFATCADGGEPDVALLRIPDRQAINDERQAAHTIERLTRAGLMKTLKQAEEGSVYMINAQNAKTSKEYAEDISKAKRLRLLEISSPVALTLAGERSSITPDGVQLLTYNESTATANADNLDGIFKTYLSKISERFKLNKEQDRALQIVCGNTLRTNGEKLKMYLGGVGGTGKSQVINAIVAFFNDTGRGRKIAVLAPTGTAASLVGGQTYHSFLHISRSDDEKNDGKVMRTDEQQSQVQRIREVQFIIIDEVSMIGCQDLFKIASRLASVRGVSDEPFGGVHIMFSGDFGQLPPVMTTRLYAILNDIRASNAHQTKAVGRSLWEQVTTVVVLRQNMRQCQSGSDDEKLKTLLTNVRYKSCTDEDILFLLSMMPTECGGHRDVNSIVTRTSSIITATNAARDAINEKCAIRFAHETGQTLTTFFAIDRLNEKTGRKAGGERKNSRLSPAERELLLKLPSSNTEKVPGKLEICIGIPVILKKNEATELGMTNGAEGVVVGWVATEKANESKATLDTLFVKLTQPVRDIHIGSLPTNVVPIVSRSESIDCRHLDGTKRSVIRQQVPVNLNFAMTDYSSQGKTRNVNVVSLRTMRSHSAIYTALSRGTSAAGTVVLDAPDLSLIQGGLGGDPLAQEFRDIELLDEITMLRFEGLLNENVNGLTRSELITSFVQHHTPTLQHLHPSVPFELDKIGERSVYVPFNWKDTNKKRKRSEKTTAVGEGRTGRESDATKKTRTNQKAIERIGPPAPIAAQAQLIGLAWDNTNWSCAYDSVLQAVYLLWIDGQTRVYNNEPLRNAFVAIKDRQRTFEDVRDEFRLAAHTDDPQRFPTGRSCIDVYDVVKRIVSESNIGFALITECAECDARKERTCEMSGLSSMDNFENSQDALRNTSGNHLSASDYATLVFESIRQREEGAACHDRCETSLKFHTIPDLLPIEIDASWLVKPQDKLTIKINGEQQDLTYRLAAVIYHGQNHFTSYVLRRDGEALYYDGMQAGGVPFSRGQHAFIEFERVYGLGYPIPARGEDEKRAVQLLYCSTQG